MRRTAGFWAMAALAGLLTVGCDSGESVPDGGGTDGGGRPDANVSRMDGGDPGEDAGGSTDDAGEARDAADGIDASDGTDGGGASDGGGTSDDGGATSDAGGSLDDAGMPSDGGSPPLGCATNADCGADTLYCARPDGMCTAIGSCEPRPEVCPFVYDPVCTCEGNTQGNACGAAAAGENVAFAGECVTDGGTGTDGGIVPSGCMQNGECARDELCFKRIGDCEGSGVCQALPTACPDVVDPVCGCDGVTYGNACEAWAAGVNVNARGACGTACELRPPAGCCFTDDHCVSSGVTDPMRCVNEICRSGGAGTCVSDALAAGECWEDTDCRRGFICDGAIICPCGALCIRADAPGRCTRPF